ncbi:GH116 family glycosyl hydrolase [Chitinophaga alhagiae]|uniref:GH116 family glycosyl hydrolase n=1 Tax=Chitinophaga alhagiae TaxID=2203219 RepID=UPI000E5AFD29|nr:GH116 family glycosyl hydrolase [Chitinophaga alhagiae]
MKSSKNRRDFLKNFTLGAIGATALPGVVTAHTGSTGQGVPQNGPDAAMPVEAGGERTAASGARAYNGVYTGQYINRVAFPIGGIGAGMFCLEGTGAISHMSVRHNPEMFFEPAMFAAISIKGIPGGARVLEQNIPEWKKFGQRDAGLGGTGGATWGLPRFAAAEFKARFPFGEISLKDPAIPLAVRIKGWSPFTPGDEDNSSLPVGALEYRFTNTGKTTQEYVFSYNSRNFMRQGDQLNNIKALENGFILSQEALPDAPEKQGHFAIFTTDDATVTDHCWFRGGWFDPLSMVWNTIRNGEVKNNAPVEKDAPGASLFVPFRLQPGQQKTVRLMMAWYVPDSKLRIGEDVSGDHPGQPKFHRPWYSSRFKNIGEVAAYWNSQYDALQKRTSLFTNAFYKSTLPPEVVEAVAANLTILKSATVMRQYDGRFWTWEGCGDNWGSCHGSCTHVWNYAQAVPHLFPALERSLRNTEFSENQNTEGHQGFRANIPISPLVHNFHSAADGQLGGIMKVYREWRISGDNNWMKNMYPAVKTSMDYCIRTWDPHKKGMVAEPHHNTYDIEFWGPTGMCTSFYLGALHAITLMGRHLGEDVTAYTSLFRKGKEYLETSLYNGEYFIQKIQWTGLNAPDPVKAQSFHTHYSEEAQRLLQQEGPKYQYGSGCLSDGILGSWIARVCGMEEPVNAAKAKSHLLAVHKYNLKKDLSAHANPQRPTFALGNEGGLLLCSWPKGGMLSLPFVYSNEVWTGIEYQVASHLMFHGEVEKGLDIVRACRNRYDGSVRNPFNEYECGHWYARAMSSYGMLQGLTGVRFDAVDGTLHIDSRVGDFTSFIATAQGFGTVSLRNGKPSLAVAHGSIPVKKTIVAGKETSLA